MTLWKMQVRLIVNINDFNNDKLDWFDQFCLIFIYLHEADKRIYQPEHHLFIQFAGSILGYTLGKNYVNMIASRKSDQQTLLNLTIKEFNNKRI